MSNQATRRQLLAAIALADAATPQQITFRKDGVSVTLHLDHIADIRPWAKVFGATADHVKGATSRPLRYTHDGRSMRSVSLYAPTWRGLEICLHVIESEQTDPPVDADTRAKLAEVATGGETA